MQEALGELVGAAKEGLLALSVEVGLGVLRELMEEEVDEVVGPKGQLEPGPDRGPSRPRGRRGDARRPAGRGQAPAGADRGRRVRGAAWRPTSISPTVTRSERVVLERMLAGVSTRHYRRAQEPVGEQVETECAVDVEVGGVADVRGAHPRSRCGS